MPYDYTLTAIIPASAHDIYTAWLDSLAHSEMTGGKANISDEPGAEFSAWGGYISGHNLELVPGKRIVQAWRTTKFAEDHPDSIVTIDLDELDEGTLLTLTHSNVPDSHIGYEQGGWQEHYFEPMIAYFSGRRGPEAAETGEEEPAAAMAAVDRPTRRGARRTTPRPAAKRPVAKKKATRAKAQPKRAAAKKAAAPKRASVSRKPAAKKKAATTGRGRSAPAGARRKSTASKTKVAPKAKKAAARTPGTAARRPKVRTGRAGPARGGSGGGRRR